VLAIAEGNVTPAAELNIWCDPEAAARVRERNRLTMVG
jgi:inosine-uridine nucleoside N-ribohydrolase